MKRWISATALGCVAAVSLLAIGATYEATARHYAYREFPPPGRMVDIAGRRIQLNCFGSGSPTVVFEAGLDTYGSLSWSAVQGKVSKVTRTCSYSRAGIMWSDPHKGRFSAKGVADDLHTALSNAGEQGPFVMVGHSLGGPYVMTFTKYYGSDVAGIVFVDASHPDQIQFLKPVAPEMANPVPLAYKLGASLAWSGVLRVGAALSMQAQPNQTMRDINVLEEYFPTSTVAVIKEYDAMGATLAEAGTFRRLGERPLFVLTAGGPHADVSPALSVQVETIWRKLNADEATWSSRSQDQFISDSGHFIQFDDPNAVINAVESTVHAVRASQRPTS